jgi:hypothetical protein
MQRDEALMKLGLRSDATREEIQAAWRAQMRIVHPDSGSAPNSDLARELNEARDVALSQTPSTALARSDVLQELISSNASLARAPSLAAASERAIQRIVTHHVGRLTSLRRLRTAIAAVAVGLAAITAIVRSTLRPAIAGANIDAFDTATGVTIAVLALVGAALGFWAWTVRTREEMLSLDIEGAAATLDDKGTYLDTIREIGLREDWTLTELRRAVGDWTQAETGDDWRVSRVLFEPREAPFQWLARRIGRVDFGRLLLTKGLEHGFLEEGEVQREGGVRFGYRLTGRSAHS